MQPVGEPVQVTQFQLNFEGAAAAFAAVQEVQGEDHPLLWPTDESAGPDRSLWDELNRDDGTEPHEFGGEAAVAIKESLEAVSRPESSSPYRSTASLMMKMLSGDGQPLVSLGASESPTVEPAAAEAKPLRQAPRRTNGEIVEGHIILGTFEHLVTALKSVEALPEDSDGRQDIIDRLNGDIDQTDPFNTEPVIYWGSEARVIYGSLVEAADRRKTLHEVSAAYMLKEFGGESSAESSTANQETEQIAIAA